MGRLIVALSALLVGINAQSHVTFISTDPEIGLTTPQIIQRWGYPVEVHQVQTADGYLIDIHRIPFGKSGPSATRRPVIFMQHGLFLDSSVWITNRPDQSAGFLFADAGFDVWLGNVRGNHYGMKHTVLSPQSKSFWDFSFDEHSSFDLPAQIDYVLGLTGQASLNYIGHSQGTLMMFTHLSEDQTFARKIQNHFALAPIGTMNNAQGLFQFLAKNFKLPMEQAFALFGQGQFNPTPQLIQSLTSQFCQSQSQMACSDLVFLISGPQSDQFNATRLPVYLSHSPSPTSTRNTIHLMQLINSLGVVPKFDFEDPQTNFLHYGRPTPPVYNYSLVNSKTHLFYGDWDFVANKVDIQQFLLDTIPSQWLQSSWEFADYNHIDFLWGLKAPSQIYAQILSMLSSDPSLQGQILLENLRIFAHSVAPTLQTPMQPGFQTQPRPFPPVPVQPSMDQPQPQPQMIPNSHLPVQPMQQPNQGQVFQGQMVQFPAQQGQFIQQTMNQPQIEPQTFPSQQPVVQMIPNPQMPFQQMPQGQMIQQSVQSIPNQPIQQPNFQTQNPIQPGQFPNQPIQNPVFFDQPLPAQQS